MNIGIVCYASVGGSGIVATELGKALALRGHQVALHQHRDAVPARRVPGRPVLPPGATPTLSAVSRAAVPAVARQPHRAGRARVQPRHHPRALRRAARDGGVSGAAGAGGAPRRAAPRVVTTLHGTDITLVGSDPSYSRDRRLLDRAVGRRDGGVEQPARVDIRGAVGDARDRGHSELPRLRASIGGGRVRICGGASPAGTSATRIVITSRTSVRSSASMRWSRSSHRIRSERARAAAAGRRRSRAGDGAAAGARARRVGSASHAVGAQEEVVPLLSIADVFLLPSAQESFGLAALEAMACEVPVVASRVGGLPEVIEHGVSGFLHPLDDVDEMAASAVALLTDPALHARSGPAALPPRARTSSASSGSSRCTRPATGTFCADATSTASAPR